METLVQTYIEQLGERRAELSGDGAAEHHKAIRRAAAQQFPDYGLPYLIEYGVYGLVAKLADGQAS